MFCFSLFTKSRLIQLRYIEDSYKFLFFILFVFGIWMPEANAEGSRDMFPDGAPGNRGHIVWRNISRSGFRTRTLLRVFANQGEYILMGSSAVGVNQGDIELYLPGTLTGTVANEVIPANAELSCVRDQPSQGFISTRNQELAGPISVDGTGNAGGYQPCFFQAPVTGIYYVAMYGPSGNNSNASPNGGVEHNINAINTSATQATGISAWDVTVRESQSSVVDLTGRLHTFNMALNMGQNLVNLYSEVYPVTSDGYRYRIEMNGIDPFGFNLFGNQLGNLDSDGMSPLYRDILGSNGNIANPMGGVISAFPQYPIFLNEIDPVVLSFLPRYDPLTGIDSGSGVPNAPILPNVQAPNFFGNLEGSVSSVGGGGTFTFESNLPTGSFEIVLSRDGVNFDPANLQNKVINGYMAASGLQSVTWDGLGNNREPFPVGTFPYEITIRAGEYHFPMSDVENNPIGGPIYNLLNATNPRGNTVAFYDHRGYFTRDGALVPDRDPGDGDPLDDALCGGNPPSPPVANLITGEDSALPGFNQFGVLDASSPTNTNVMCTGPFGDTKTLDIWTYFPSIPPARAFVVVDPTDFGDAPDISNEMLVDDYRTLVQHGGPAHILNETSLFLGGAVSQDTNGFVDGIDDNGNATDDNDDALTALSALPVSGQYYLRDIPVSNGTATAATLHAWIDFDRDGAFEVSEYVSAAIAPNQTTADLTWSVPATVSPGPSYARFRLTRDTLSDDASTAFFDERSVGLARDGEVEDYQIMLLAAGSAPQVLLVKRITAVANQQETNPNDGTPLDQFVDMTIGAQADDDNHPSWPANYLIGALHGGDVRPVSERSADTVEYTIYFLSVGGVAANGVLLCDRIPQNTQYLSDAYNNIFPAAPLGDPFSALGMALDFAGAEQALTGKHDGDAGYYFPPGVEPSTVFPNVSCGGSNDNGAVVADLGSLPPASSAGNPANAYGALRFQVQVR